MRDALTSLLLVVVFAAGGLGLHNGMVLRVDHHGHVILDAPHLSHGLAHADGADHDAADYGARADHPSDAGTDDDHHDLHHLIATIADSHVATAKSDGSTASQSLSSQHSFSLDLYFPAALSTPTFARTRSALEAANHRGGTARAEIASLRAIVLLV